MGSAQAPLSGYGPQDVYVYVGFVSYDIGGNYSTWYWELLYRNNGGAQWASDPNHRWQLDGFADTGWNYFGIPSSWVGSGDHVLGNGYFTKGHDANGYLSAGVLRGIIETAEASIGSGYADASTGTPPRVPKPPPAPSVADPWGWNMIEADKARFQFQSTGDGGAAVDQWQFQVATNSAFTGATSYTSGGTTTVTGLTPGTTYYARARGHNAAGWGAWSATDSMTTLSGIYVSDGEVWVPQPVRVSDGASTWENVLLKISDSDSWEGPLDV